MLVKKGKCFHFSELFMKKEYTKNMFPFSLHVEGKNVNDMEMKIYNACYKKFLSLWD